MGLTGPTSRHVPILDTCNRVHLTLLINVYLRFGDNLEQPKTEIKIKNFTLLLRRRKHVAVTQILWRPRGLLVDQFDSKEDLINAVFTSSFIPGYLAPRPATMFRNRLCIDGGLTLFMPPTSATQTIRVCAFPASRLGLQGIGISPDCNPESRATPRELENQDRFLQIR
ncbi:hypothetical protein ACSBR1_022631 [Camellia fascicularis]